jgi:CheY-like chemotaxis protein
VLVLVTRKKTVLYIEDDADVIAMFQVVFRGDPVNWAIAPNGIAGLRMVRELRPDLVILDLMLPDISGQEVFERMQADPQLKNIPVWVLTVKWWKANEYPWREPAIVSYTFKPFKPYEFRKRVLCWLGIEPQPIEF